MSPNPEIILRDQLETLFLKVSNETQRNLKLQCFQKKATVVTGIRRCGKSTLLRQHLMKTQKQAKDGSSLPPFYLSFFDERISDLKVQDLNDFIVAYGGLHEGRLPTQFLLDEIQLIEGWENFVARLLENPNNEVYLTGSSSKLLSKEIASSLRGRSIRYELFPFAWSEYLPFRGFDSDKVNSSQKGKMNKMFLEYLQWGGFPETISVEVGAKQKILQEYFEVLLYRDLIERNHFDRSSIARKLLVTLIRMYGNKCSINQTHKKLTAEGLHVDKNALSDFVRWCEDAYILFSVRLWTSSEHRARTNPQKLYTADLGLAQACETWSDQNLGRRFENACFCFLRAQPDFLSLNYYITERGGEVDFIFENLAGQRFLYQICWELAAESKEREITALTEAMAELNLKKGYIVTFKQNETIKVASGQIQVISFDKFFKK